MKSTSTKATILSIIVTIIFHPLVSVSQAGEVKANGITIAYESFGSPKNETILLISGTNAQLTMWPMEFCDGLVKRGYRVIRFDNRDIGLSTKFDSAGMPDWPGITKALQEKTPPPLPYTLDDMADDAVALLDSLGIKKAHVAGASMGGMIAQRIAYNHPEHTLSLASISAGGGDTTFPLIAKPDVINKIPQPPDPMDTAAYIKREMQTMTILAGPIYPPEPEKLAIYVKNNVKRSYYPDGFFRQGAVAMCGFYAGRQDKLKTIHVPAVVIHGSEDPVVAIEAGKNVADNIPGAKFELIKGMGHDLPSPLIDKLVDIIANNASRKNGSIKPAVANKKVK